MKRSIKTISNYREEAKLFQIMLDSLSDAVVAMDSQGKVLIVNRSAQRIIGNQDLLGPINNWSHTYGFYLPDTVTLYPPEDYPLVRAMRGEVVNNAEMFVRNHSLPNGVWLSINGCPVHVDGIGTVGLVVCRDISDCKQAVQKQLTLSQELKRSNAELQQFAIIASHDLKEPLRGVVECLNLIEEIYKDKLDHKAYKLIEHAIDGAEHMDALISDLLLFSNITSEKQNMQHTDLSVILKSVLKNLRVSINESKVKITHDPLPIIIGDKTKLAQLFQNLISNAIKFRSDKVPEIHIGVQPQKNDWLFSVHDNGIGLQQEHVERIFLPFKRLHGKNKYPGTGIGLTICKKIVEYHHGSIWVESNPETGAIFYFTLPII